METMVPRLASLHRLRQMKSVPRPRLKRGGFRLRSQPRRMASDLRSSGRLGAPPHHHRDPKSTERQ
jgi:hypothetical protein